MTVPTEGQTRTLSSGSKGPSGEVEMAVPTQRLMGEAPATVAV